MLIRRLRSGSLVLSISLGIAACGSPVGSPVAIRTMDTTCYTSGIDGDLVTDPVAGTAVTGSFYGGRVTLAWPRGYMGRRTGGEVEVIDRHGNVAYRTGTRVSLLGGFGQSGDFEVCGLEMLNSGS